MPVLGVDATASGWVGIVLDDDDRVRALAAPTIAALVEAAGPVEVVGIDIPIGLVDAGRRASDRAARQVLGGRRSSIFFTPVRAAVEAATYDEANARSRELSGDGLSRQAYGLREKILDVDGWVASAGCPVREVHPEVSFATLAGHPLTASKKKWAGYWERRTLLAGVGIEFNGDLGAAGLTAAVDDVLDAAIVAWSARRIRDGRAISFPDPPETTATGAELAIWA